MDPGIVLKVEGTNADVGRCIGTRFRHRILVATEETVGQLSSAGIDRATLAARQAPYLERVEESLPHLLDELRNLAEAAAAPFEVVFFLNAGGLRTASREYLAQLEVRGENGCTSVGSRGDRGIVVGHNEDAAPECIDDLFLLDATVSSASTGSQVRFAGLSYAYNLPGCAASRNQHGLTLLVDTLVDPQPGIGVPCDFLTRAILEHESIDSAIEFLRRVQRSGAASLTLAQDDRLTSIELTSSELAVIEDREYLVHTNHFLVPELQLRALAPTTESSARLARAQSLVRRGMTPDEMKQLLSDRAGGPYDICRTRTIASFVARTNVPGFEFCVGSPDQAEWSHWHI